jgi:hypothetical protein
MKMYQLYGAALALGSWTLPALAQENADVLAKQLSNPVAALISVPLQLNADFGFGDDDGSRYTLNVQPVIPTALNDQWNLVSRIIMPVIYQDDVIADSTQSGLGDITPTFFFSPRAPGPGGMIWGVGPVFLLPSATDDLLGTEKWGIGPSALALVQTEGGLTYGALVNHIESVAGEENRADVSNTFIQPFIAKQFSGGRTLTFNAESTYDWEGEQWTVPLIVVYSKVTKIGDQMLSFAGGARVYVEKPDNGPDWGVRFVVTLLYPN